MKGTEADQVRARFAQLHVIANNFDDIRGRPNFVCLAHLGPCPDDTERAESAVTPSDSRTSVFQYTRMWRRMLVLVEGIRPVPGRRVGTTRGAVVRDQRPEPHLEAASCFRHATRILSMGSKAKRNHQKTQSPASTPRCFLPGPPQFAIFDQKEYRLCGLLDLRCDDPIRLWSWRF